MGQANSGCNGVSGDHADSVRSTVPGIEKVGALLKVQWKIKWQYRER